jgi:hypothetical protein
LCFNTSNFMPLLQSMSMVFFGVEYFTRTSILQIIKSFGFSIMARFLHLLLTNLLIMRSILYLIAVIFIIIWIWQFFFSGNANPSGLIHILLVLAVISLLIGIIRRA